MRKKRNALLFTLAALLVLAMGTFAGLDDLSDWAGEGGDPELIELVEVWTLMPDAAPGVVPDDLFSGALTKLPGNEKCLNTGYLELKDSDGTVYGQITTVDPYFLIVEIGGVSRIYWPHFKIDSKGRVAIYYLTNDQTMPDQAELWFGPPKNDDPAGVYQPVAIVNNRTKVIVGHGKHYTD